MNTSNMGGNNCGLFMEMGSSGYRRLPRYSRIQSGFTLPELMITLIIAGILLTLAVPSFNETIRNNRRAGLMSDFAGSLQTAKTEAVKRNGQVVMCVSADGEKCTDTEGWEQGWLIYRDDDADETLDAADEPVLHVADAFPSGYDLRATAGNMKKYVLFRGMGDVMGDGGNNAIFRLCGPDADAAKAKYISVTAVGLIRAADADGSTCP